MTNEQSSIRHFCLLGVLFSELFMAILFGEIIRGVRSGETIYLMACLAIYADYGVFMGYRILNE